jgi:hypothetical protein
VAPKLLIFQPLLVDSLLTVASNLVFLLGVPLERVN